MPVTVYACDFHRREMAVIFYLFPKRQILESSKLKEFADDNFKVDENFKKFSKWIKNTVGKGEIARCKQFLLFPQTCNADT